MSTTTHPLRISAEAGTLLVLLMGTGWFLGEGSGKWWWPHVSPHPAWALIIIMALRYGSPTGPIIGALCAMCHLIALRSGGLDLASVFHLDPKQLFEPLLYLVVGSAIGGTVSGLNGRIDFWRKGKTQSEHELAELEDRFNKLSRDYRVMERDIGSKGDSIGIILDAVINLDLDSREGVLQGMGHIMTTHLGIGRYRVFDLIDDRWKQILPEQTNDLAPPLAMLSLDQGHCLSALEVGETGKDLTDTTVLAGPIITRGQHASYLVTVDHMRFLAFHETTVQTLDSLLKLVGRRIGALKRLQNLESRIENRPAVEMISHNRFIARLEAELIIAKNEKISVTIARGTMGGAMPGMVAYRLGRVLRRIVGHLLGPNDCMAVDDNGAYHLMLFEADEAKAQNLTEMTNRALSTFDFRPYSSDPQRPLEINWNIARFTDQRTATDLLTLLDTPHGNTP